MKAIDLRLHLGASLYGPELAPEQAVAAMDRVGIALAAVSHAKPRDYRFEPANDRIAAWARDRADRFLPFARVDPWQGDDALREICRCLDELDMRGLFLHPWEENFPANDAIVDPLCRLLLARGLPLVIAGGHARVSSAWQLGELAGRWPDLHVVATSGGQINIAGAQLHEAETLLDEHPNVLMETSGIYRQDFIEDCARRFGAERIVFGSGAPVFDLDLEYKRVAWAHLDETARTRILHHNAAALLKLDSAPHEKT